MIRLARKITYIQDLDCRAYRDVSERHEESCSEATDESSCKRKPRVSDDDA